MHCPDRLLSVSPSLSEQLRRRANELRSRIIRTNYSTQFAQTAPELAEFRDATIGLIDEIGDDALSESFRKTVPLTTYDTYAPLIARFLEKPCKASTVINLLAPGLPDFLVRSSSTSGGRQKTFPKYDRLSKFASSDTSLWTVSDPLRRRTSAFISLFRCDRILLEDENNRPVKTVYSTVVSVVNRRTPLNLHPEKDKERMATFIRDHTAPFAVGFIRKYRTFLLIHVLFALGSRSLETMTIPYTSMFVDMMRNLDTEFDMIMDCIASGTIPDLDGMAEVRHYLEMNIFPDPERAAELRSLGRPSSRPGWCNHAWPNLHSLTTIASGSFATYIPLTQWFLGPNTEIRPRGYRSTEAQIALPYSPFELNKYKLDNESAIEFLDISKTDSISALAQIWEVGVGRRYEVVLTTQDGLWRYRLGDVVEISGFDPTDGTPIIQFIERRNVAIRFAWFMVTEEELSTAILSMAPNAPLQIVGWTAMIDHRRTPSTIGFFVELAGDQVIDLVLATQHVFDKLFQLIQKVAHAIESEAFGKPTIRLVQPGTFGGFLQLKLDESDNHHFGSVKIPVVLSNAVHVTWFSDRVIQEL